MKIYKEQVDNNTDTAPDIDVENIGKIATVKSDVRNFHGMQGEVSALYRSEQGMPIDGYWVEFGEPEGGLWFLPTELNIH